MSSSEAAVVMNSCSVCYDSLAKNQLIKICSNDEREICIDCYVQYVRLLLKDSIAGVCPLLLCPLCKSKQCLISPAIIQFLPPDLLELYKLRSKSLLSLQCGSCHQRSSLYLEKDTTGQHVSILQERLGTAYQEFASDMLKYETGLLSIPDFYLLLINKYFQEMAQHNSERRWHLMRSILSIMGNPERKANLHLRYLKNHPFVSTLCCSRLQCFECRTTDAHPGKTCHEISSSRPISEMIKCPSCSIHIIKGDGCDSVSCVCGAKFTFSTELRKYNQALLFQECYPINTAFHCVTILCGEALDRNITPAKSWYDIHEPECQPSFLQFWSQKYPFCPTQCALVVKSSQSQYFEKAKHLWIQYHQDEYQLLKFSSELAQLSLWDSLYPSINLKRECVTRNSKSLFDPMLTALTMQQREVISSVMRIFAKHDSGAKRYSHQIEKFACLQFLAIFGHVPVGLRETTNTHGVTLGANLATIDQPYIMKSSPFSGHLTLETGYIVSSLLSRHNGSLGTIVTVYDEDNTYDVEWLSLNQTERIHRNYLRLKGKGKRYRPHCDQNSEQLQIFKRFLKYLHSMLSISNDGGIDMGEEEKEEDYSISNSESDIKMIQSWKLKCEAKGIDSDQELDNLHNLLELFASGENMEFLVNLSEVLPAHYPLHSLTWRDLYSAIVYRISLKRRDGR